jgi:hypothetical protein
MSAVLWLGSILTTQQVPATLVIEAPQGETHYVQMLCMSYGHNNKVLLLNEERYCVEDGEKETPETTNQTERERLYLHDNCRIALIKIHSGYYRIGCSKPLTTGSQVSYNYSTSPKLEENKVYLLRVGDNGCTIQPYPSPLPEYISDEPVVTLNVTPEE